jgi:hypothetical protein
MPMATGSSGKFSASPRTPFPQNKKFREHGDEKLLLLVFTPFRARSSRVHERNPGSRGWRGAMIGGSFVIGAL